MAYYSNNVKCEKIVGLYPFTEDIMVNRIYNKKWTILPCTNDSVTSLNLNTGPANKFLEQIVFKI